MSMRRLLLLLAMLLCVAAAFGKDKPKWEYFKAGSIQYMVVTDTTVAVSYVEADKNGNIVIPPYVSNNGKQYKVVAIGSFSIFSGIVDGKDYLMMSVGDGYYGVTDMYSIYPIECPVAPSANNMVFRGIYNIDKYHGSNTDYTADLVKRSDATLLHFIKNPLEVVSCKLPNTLEIIGDWSFSGCENLKEIEIPNSVKAIGNNAFELCNSLTSLTIPNSVVSIGYNAFDFCGKLEKITIPNSVRLIRSDIFCRGQSRLRYIVLPDKEPMYRNRPRKSYEEDTYQFSRVLEDVRGNMLRCPKYVVDMIHRTTHSGVSSSPFVKNVLPAIESSFSFFAADKVYAQIEQWQKKKEYETTAQYRSRVNEANMQQQVRNIVGKLQQQYIEQRTAGNPSMWLGTYDADYGTYKVSINNADVYANVPVSDAPSFKENFGQVRIQPHYGIVDDQLAILSCDFMLNGKTYHSAKTYSNDDASAGIAANLPTLNLDFGQEQNAAMQGGHSLANNTTPAIPASDDIDTNIPVAASKNEKTFAVIIGNENYQRVAKVQYAANDARVFGEYCQKTLGIPMQNIRKYNDATYGTMLSALQDIKDITNAYDGQASVIFYYAGHGIPDETDKRAYLLPVDADGKQPKACLPLSELYKELGALNAKSVVAFIDACFSGSQRGDGMLAAARGVAIKTKAESPQGNLVVVSAASDNETAFPYNEKRHGMFTYYILKDLQATKGNTTLGDLADNVTRNVKQQSVVINRKPQTPTVSPSPSVAASWRSINF